MEWESSFWNRRDVENFVCLFEVRYIYKWKIYHLTNSTTLRESRRTWSQHSIHLRFSYVTTKQRSLTFALFFMSWFCLQKIKLLSFIGFSFALTCLISCPAQVLQEVFSVRMLLLFWIFVFQDFLCVVLRDCWNLAICGGWLWFPTYQCWKITM